MTDQAYVYALAQEIRRVDGNHKLGAAELAEALMPFICTRLIAELGQEVGAEQAPVAWADNRGLERLREGKQEMVSGVRLGSDTTALYLSPAHTSEARDAAFVETLAREYSLLRGWSLDDWNNPSVKNRADIIADMRMAYDAAMRQEAGSRD